MACLMRAPGFMVRCMSTSGRKSRHRFRGTDPASARDWVNNYGQLFGDKVPPQYEAAYRFARNAAAQYGKDYDIVLTGHSLGGGQAQYAALALANEDGIITKAITFNSAGLAW